MTHITRDIVLNEGDIRERFVGAPGRGSRSLGHHATAVQLRVDLGKLALPADVEERLLALGGRHINTDGELVVVARADRSQARNREAAHSQLIALLERAARVSPPRRPTKPKSIVKKARRTAKQQHAALKRARRGSEV